MYQCVDAALLRAAAHPAGMDLPAWPDVTGDSEQAVERWRAWLRRVWSVPWIAEAIEVASPVLAGEIQKVCAGGTVDSRRTRRIVTSTARYVLRATSRATPFGLFAGVAPAQFGTHTQVYWGGGHRVTTRIDSAWLASVVSDLEACPALLTRLSVVANNIRLVRGGRVVAPDQQHVGDTDIELPRPVEVSVRHTRLVEAALWCARSPVVLADLADMLASEVPGAPLGRIVSMLAELVRVRLLLTVVRPPMTVTDPLSHVLTTVAAVGAGAIPQIADRVRDLHVVRAAVSGPGQQRDAARPRMGVDLRLDARIVLPAAVARESEAAAAALTRLTPHPSGMPAWQEYHGAWLERYGPGAVVPLGEVTNPHTGLGYPATYRGSTREAAESPLSTRDERLLVLAQTAAMTGTVEVVIDERMIRYISGEDSDRWPGVAHVEVVVQVHAASHDALDRGEFAVVVTGASRAAGATTGRLLDLLDPDDRDRVQRLYASLPTARAGALSVQVSCPPVFAQSEAVARAPQVLPTVIHAGEHPTVGGAAGMPLDDLAVTGDANGLCLVSVSQGRPVEPTVFNAVEFRHFSHPMVRFLCEITRARAPVYMPFDWGAAAGLPFLPRIRHGRAVLAPARWNLSAADMPGAGAAWPQWTAAFTEWRRRFRTPEAVYLAETDQLLRLDLTENLHRQLLRTHLDRHRRATLHEAPDPAAFGWIDSRAHEIVVPLAATTAPAPAPAAGRTARARVAGREPGHLPGDSQWLYAKLYGPAEQHPDVLACLPDLLAAWPIEPPPRWWYVRYRDPHPHLRLRIHLQNPSDYGDATRHVGQWAAELRRCGLASRLVYDTYYPETGRYGTGAAMAAAEAVFAADSAAALAQFTGAAGSTPQFDAVTAASLIDIATGFTGDTRAGMRWLVDHIRNDAAGRPDHHAVRRDVLRLLDPTDGHAALRAVPGGDRVLATWRERASALVRYRAVLDGLAAADTDTILGSLLHLHHIRVTGIAPEHERACHRLARSTALSWIACTPEGSP